MNLTTDQFLSLARTNPANSALLERLPELDVKQCYLTAGCLFQTVWNHRSGNAPGAGIHDYDVFYFDPDLSWEAEDVVIQQAAELFSDVPVKIEVRNQARVHLWYERRFGQPRSPLKSSRDGIGGFLVECTCVGIDVETGQLYAPYGLDDLWNGLLRINPNHGEPHLFARKAASYRARWPWLTIVDP